MVRCQRGDEHAPQRMLPNRIRTVGATAGNGRSHVPTDAPKSSASLVSHKIALVGAPEAVALIP